ncbi:hypothetical protein TGP89_245770 [Toxoplasma gondii p89]|uniref:Transmembrane protein n=2 Tax=Toxoplasma gondii TaxID=5811 RepID=A0A086KTR2_TOXGO|nr:hypothetical protein TGP89_245770 [Toxoplasma gondii p89]
MPFLGARSWLRPLIALHALVEGLAGFHSLPGLQGGTVLLWFPVLPEHQEAAASSAPHGTESTEESDSSDDDDIDPSLPEGSERVSRRSSRWSASGETPVSQQASSRAPSEPARNVEEQLELLRAERRRLAARMRRLRLLWSGEEVFVRMCIHTESVRRHRKGKPAVTPSTERIAKLRSLYQQRSNEKKQEMLQLQRELQAVAKQKTQLHQEWRLLRIRGSRGTHGWEAQPGSSTSTDESQSESPNADLLSTESAAHTSSPEKTWHTATTSCTASDASRSSCRLDSTNRRICNATGSNPSIGA